MLSSNPPNKVRLHIGNRNATWVRCAAGQRVIVCWRSLRECCFHHIWLTTAGTAMKTRWKAATIIASAIVSAIVPGKVGNDGGRDVAAVGALARGQLRNGY
ncbi:unnamed protein product [Aspergillus oryzae]|uniref:Unnamed protein product n=1 Tax=Aspergillus oryzae var. brunneus TaxID=332754 RepID=A0ABQ6KSL4_ASPOZ|nr:unnamed protein product [Aspergillus oryzae]GMF96365.1 unnamed protein product [Aspergillus oryzae]GMG14762.1 unnamed protein product [Aspergillus oryzae]GMG48357.1 unnamed protein product [Aspergillus oryzae var. brunneus]